MTSLSKTLDQYFTPPKLAQNLIDAVTLDNPTSVVDFAAGDGELLRAAIIKWPDVICNAIDIDSAVVNVLKNNYPKWNIDCCDFTKPKERSSATFLEQNKRFPLIILNPPFSWKGKTLQQVEIGGISTRCSPALAFVITAASYLETGGQLVAIVPYGLVYNERDRVTRNFLKANYTLEVVGTYDNGGFANCSPRTAIIRLTALRDSGRQTECELSMSHETKQYENTSVSVKRGRVQDNLIKSISGEVPFIHTTNLKENNICNINRYVGNNYIPFKGPGVIMPRVGRPSMRKIVLVNDEKSFVMSECLFLLECTTVSEATDVYNCLSQNWNYIIGKQGGTCANFLSIQTMIDCLTHFGFNVLSNGKSVRLESQILIKERKMVFNPH